MAAAAVMVAAAAVGLASAAASALAGLLVGVAAGLLAVGLAAPRWVAARPWRRKQADGGGGSGGAALTAPVALVVLVVLAVVAALLAAAVGVAAAALPAAAVPAAQLPLAAAAAAGVLVQKWHGLGPLGGRAAAGLVLVAAALAAACRAMPYSAPPPLQHGAGVLSYGWWRRAGHGCLRALGRGLLQPDAPLGSAAATLHGGGGGYTAPAEAGGSAGLPYGDGAAPAARAEALAAAAAGVAVLLVLCLGALAASPRSGLRRGRRGHRRSAASLAAVPSEASFSRRSVSSASMANLAAPSAASVAPAAAAVLSQEPSPTPPAVLYSVYGIAPRQRRYVTATAAAAAISSHPLSDVAAVLPPGAAAAAADATALLRALAAAAAAVGRLLKMLYGSLVAATLVAVASAVASGTDTAASLAASSPRTLRTVLWALRAGASYKRFQASCYGVDTDEDPEYQAALSQLHTYWANQLLAVCRRNGGVYVKAGQFAAAFGAVPREYRAVLSQLEDRAVPKPYRTVRRALARELGGAVRVAGLFSSFNRRATAAASLAQVHHAVLADGREVAVKVQYPGLAGCVAADLTTMRCLAAAAAALFPAIRLGWVGEELARKLEVELDFRNEIANSHRFRNVLAECDVRGAVRVPAFHEHLCTSKVLVMEWIDGCKITDVEALQRQGINPRAVGRLLVRLFGELMFLRGYVHGDPHPGNLMVRPKGRPGFLRWLLRGSRRGFEVVVLDHGTYLDVDPALRQQFCQLWCSVLLRDEAAQADISLDMAGPRGGRILPLLLTQRARNAAEEAKLRARLGIRGFGDMTSLLSAVSTHLVDLLRVVTVIRASSAALGVTMAERTRVYSAVAARGLPSLRALRRGGGGGGAGGGGGGGSPQPAYLHRAFTSASHRARLHAILFGLGVWTWTSAVLGRTWDTLLSVFGEALFG